LQGRHLFYLPRFRMPGGGSPGATQISNERKPGVG
jgi:hypothetical protein